MNSLIRLTSIITLLTFFLVCASCDKGTKSAENRNDARLLEGTWVLKSHIKGAKEVPAKSRQLQLTAKADGAFTALYRGDESQKWIQAGQGAILYSPPKLTLYWDNGRATILTVLEKSPDRLVLHHGRNLAPLADQEPDDVFVAEPKGSKAPQSSGPPPGSNER